MKNEKGFIPVLIAVIAVAVVAVLGFVMLNKNKTPGKSIIPVVKLPVSIGLNANCKLNDPDLCKYMDQASKMTQFQTGFSGKSVTSNKTGVKNESTWEMAGTGKSHFVTMENGKEAFNTIILDGVTYTKDMSDGKWWKYTPAKDSKTNKSLFDPEEMKNKLKDTVKDVVDKTTYKNLGKETCGSLMCFKYQIITPGLTEATEYLYFDDHDYLMRKMRTEMPDGTVTETAFDYSPVTINIPSPVKEGEPGLNMFNLPAGGAKPGSGNSQDVEKIKEDAQKFIEQMNKSSAGSVNSDTSPDTSGGSE